MHSDAPSYTVKAQCLPVYKHFERIFSYSCCSPKCSVYDSSIVHLGVQVNAFFVFQWHVEESFFLVERAHLPHFVIGQCEVENPDVLFYVVAG